MKSKNSVDMCSGPLFGKILRFVIPFMLTSVAQQLYHAADVMVVGRYAGREALAGVGSSGSLTTMIINLFIGLSSGVNVVLGHAMGEKNDDKIKKTVSTAMCISVIGGLVVSIIGILFAEPLLRAIDTPEDVLPQAKIYMQIIMAGKIPALIYNFGSAILRSKGDSKRPLYIVLISGLINVAFNLFFVIVCGMAAEGVALATVISQVFTAVAVLYILSREHDSTRLNLKKLRIDKKQLIEIIKIGVPSGIQSTIFGFSNVLIQSGVNSFGAATVAGNSAASSVGAFYHAIVVSFYHAALPFVSQNMGAKKYDRIRKIVRICLLDVLVVWALEIIVTLFANESLIRLYAPSDLEVIKMGVKRNMILGCTYGLCGIMDVMAGAVRGMGYSFRTMVASLTGACGIRIVWILTVFKAIGTYESLIVSLPVSWIGTFLFHTVSYFIIMRKLTKTDTIALEQQV